METNKNQYLDCTLIKEKSNINLVTLYNINKFKKTFKLK
jgi:hypothetical protein